MATVNIVLEAPDASIPLMRRTLAAIMGEPVPLTGPDTKSLIERYIKSDIKSRMIDQKRFESEAAARSDTSDGVANW